VRLGLRSKDPGDSPGLEVIEITPGGSAEAAGIKTGDLLLQWNKKEMNSREDLVAELRTHQPGDKIQAVLRRGDEEITVYVDLKGGGAT
jgi:S1-C subfamily serine protease